MYCMNTACIVHIYRKTGDAGIGIFRKLWGSLMESSMMYGAEIWGYSRHLELMDHVQTISGNHWWKKSATVMVYKDRVSPSSRP